MPSTATPPTTKLPDFEGIPVHKATVRITNAGDGLSEALSFEPIALHHGDEVFFVLKGLCTQVNHKPDGKIDDEHPIDDADLVRLHTVTALEIAMVDEGDVSALLEQNRERVDAQRRQREREEQRQREAEAGAMRLPGADPEADLLAEHDTGGHAKDLVDACPECQAEIAAARKGD